MSKGKNRHVKEFGVSVYSMWALMGLAYGYSIIRHPKKKKLFLQLPLDKDFNNAKKIQETSINALLEKKLLAYSMETSNIELFTITQKGFDLLEKKLAKVNLKLDKTIENQKEKEEFDSSVYYG